MQSVVVGKLWITWIIVVFDVTGSLFRVAWRSVNPLMSTLGLDEAEGSDAELSGVVTAPLNSLFE